MFDVAVREEAPSLVVAPSGELDVSTRPALEEALDAAVCRQDGHTIVDLRGIEFMDAAGAGLLVRSAERAAAAGGRLSLILGPPASYRVLEVCGLLRRFEILAAGSDGVAA